eukprot:gene15658-biopygen1151
MVHKFVERRAAGGVRNLVEGRAPPPPPNKGPRRREAAGARGADLHGGASSAGDQRPGSQGLRMQSARDAGAVHQFLGARLGDEPGVRAGTTSPRS